MVAIAVLHANVAPAQMMPGGSGHGPYSSVDPSGVAESDSPIVEKPDVTAQKAMKAGMKSINEAKALEATAATATDPDKKAKALEKSGELYMTALDRFTDALGSQSGIVDAWDNAGYAHLRLGAYVEAVDDYDHTLALKPGLFEAVEHRAEAYLALDRLDDVKSAYMDVFNHEPALAARLMTVIQAWVSSHRVDSHGVRAADIEAFGRWAQEREGIARGAAP